MSKCGEKLYMTRYTSVYVQIRLWDRESHRHIELNVQAAPQYIQHLVATLSLGPALMYRTVLRRNIWPTQILYVCGCARMCMCTCI